MKKYYTTIPQQPAGKLYLTEYKNPGSSPLLNYGETRFPIVPVIANSAEKGETVKVYGIKPAYESTDIWLAELKAELDALAAEKGFRYEFVQLDVSVSEVVETHLDLFRRLTETAETGDRIYTDITFGSKPIPIILLMFMNYAYKNRENTAIECIVYGAVNHSDPGPKKSSSLYDVSALFYMNATVNSMTGDASDVISMLLDLGKAGDDDA